jgi:hypothetical protein
MRLAAKCETAACKHYTGSSCALATKIVARLDPVVDVPPPCSIRPSCRWYDERGKAACVRCPQVVTELHPGEAVSAAMQSLAE